MSGFFVLGVPQEKLDEIVVRRVATMERRLKAPPRPGSTERRRQKVLSALHTNPPREVLSHEFSVPQFCQDFILLAEKRGFSFLATARKEGRTWQMIEED